MTNTPATAPVNAPFSWPKSSLSTRFSGIAAQFNVINGLSHSKTNIVLMHDSNGHTSTVNALRDIIRYGKNNGYTFKAITSDTPIVRHGVNN